MEFSYLKGEWQRPSTNKDNMTNIKLNAIIVKSLGIMLMNV